MKKILLFAIGLALIMPAFVFASSSSLNQGIYTSAQDAHAVAVSGDYAYVS